MSVASWWKPVWIVIKGTSPVRYKRGWVLMTTAACNKRALRAAVADLGVKESPAGSNLQRYGKHWGENGVPWCGLAVAYWLQQGGHTISKSLAQKLGYVPTIVNLATQKSGRLSLIYRSRVQPGDIVTYEFDGDNTPDHTGLFEKWINKSEGTFYAIEGNTSLGNDSNGGEVMRRQRSTGQVRAFVRKLVG